MRHKGRVFPSQTMPPRLIGVPAYFFVGYAWGCGVWSELASSMIQYIVPEKRWEVFDCTANAYFCGKLGKPYWIL
jgi:hypothetical protein